MGGRGRGEESSPIIDATEGSPLANPSRFREIFLSHSGNIPIVVITKEQYSQPLLECAPFNIIMRIIMRPAALTVREVMTIVIAFQLSGYRTFKPSHYTQVEKSQ
jgi:hypothetical protein